MDDYFDAAAIAEISAQLEAELAGHNFELVFDYTPYDGVQAPEGYQEPEFHFPPEFQLPNETPARFYFDEEGRPCSGDDEERQCEIIATMKPSKDAPPKTAETEVVKEMERPMSPMPMLIQEDPQTNADLEDYTPSCSVPPLEAIKPTSSADFVKTEPARTPEPCDSDSKSTEKPMTRTRRPRTITKIPPSMMKQESSMESTFSPIAIHPAPSTSLEGRQKVPHPGTLQIYERKLPKRKPRIGSAFPTNPFNSQNLATFGKRPRIADVIQARRMNPYSRF